MRGEGLPPRDETFRQFVNTHNQDFKTVAKREAALLLGFLAFGLLLLPVLIYVVGKAVFGEYGGTGFWDFFGNLHGALREGSIVVWFLVLSPYLVIQALRLTVHWFRRLGRRDVSPAGRLRR